MPTSRALGQHSRDETATRVGEHVDDEPGVVRKHLGQVPAVLDRIDRDRGMVEREDAALVALVEAGDDLGGESAETRVGEAVGPVDDQQCRAGGHACSSASSSGRGAG